MIILYIPSVDDYHQNTDSTYNPSEIHDEESTGSFNCIITELEYLNIIYTYILYSGPFLRIGNGKNEVNEMYLQDTLTSDEHTTQSTCVWLPFTV